jgi:hypothetical protein
MNISHLTKVAGAIAVVLGLSACGGGGSGDTSATASSASVGTITGFGSIFVNGVEYETDGATIIIDDNPGSESDLAVGMVVELTGSASGATGRALTINASDELEGIVQSNSIPPAGNSGTLVIMGQTVTVDLNTLFESTVAGVNGIDQVVAGHIVEVSGYSDGAGAVFATRVEVKAPDLASYLIDHPNGVEVKGLVSNLDAAMQTFDIGAMPVSYAGALVDNDFTLANGVFVEVKSVAGIDGTGTLVASKVELEDDGVKGHQGDDGDEFEIKAVISTPFDGTSFSMDGTTVVVTGNTEFRRGDTSGLLAGVLVEAEGNFNAAGELVAEKINFEDEGDTEVEGTVTDVTTTGVNTGTVTLQDGSVITVTSTTIMKDSRDEGMTPDLRFNLQALVIGDFVEIHLFVDAASGDKIAVKLEREDP